MRDRYRKQGKSLTFGNNTEPDFMFIHAFDSDCDKNTS